jgi:ParB/RepB/Spo0J family partition protein
MTTIESERSARNTAAENVELRTTAIRPSLQNPRKHFDSLGLKELADSIKEHGILEPIVVRWIEGDGIHEIIAGERRWRAAIMAELAYIPCRVLADVDDRKALELALVENLARRDVNPIEAANGYAALKEMGYTGRDIAAKLSIDESTVANAIRLLKLPEAVQAHINKGEISATHGKALAGFVDYPKLLGAKLELALSGRPAKEVEGVRWEYPLANNGILERVRSVDIGVDAAKQCLDCQHRRKHDGDGWLCLDVDCLNAKKAAKHKEEVAKVKEIAGSSAAVVDCNKLGYGNYVKFEKDNSNKPAGCRDDCDKRRAADYYKELCVICTDKPCWDRLKSAETRSANAIRRSQTAERMERAAEVLNIDGTRELAVAVAARIFTNLNPKITAQLSKKYKLGFEDELFTNRMYQRSYRVYGALMAVDPATLMRAMVEGLLIEDAKYRDESDYRETRLLDWMAAVPSSVLVQACPMCGKDFDAESSKMHGGEGIVCGYDCRQKYLKAKEANGEEIDGQETDDVDVAAGVDIPAAAAPEPEAEAAEDTEDIEAGPQLYAYIAEHKKLVLDCDHFAGLGGFLVVGDLILPKDCTDCLPSSYSDNAREDVRSQNTMEIKAIIGDSVELVDGTVIWVDDLIDWELRLSIDTVFPGDQVTSDDNDRTFYVDKITPGGTVSLIDLKTGAIKFHPCWAVFAREWTMVRRAPRYDNDVSAIEEAVKPKTSDCSKCITDADDCPTRQPDEVCPAWTGVS